MNDSEKSMAEGIRRGDNRAMRDFYATFGGQLTAVCSRYVADDDDVKDVIQESLLSIISNIHTFEYHGKGSLLSAFFVRKSAQLPFLLTEMPVLLTPPTIHRRT